MFRSEFFLGTRLWPVSLPLSTFFGKPRRDAAIPPGPHCVALRAIGFKHAALDVSKDKELDSLRARDDFKKLTAELEHVKSGGTAKPRICSDQPSRFQRCKSCCAGCRFQLSDSRE
jgi:hypothetical protein